MIQIATIRTAIELQDHFTNVLYQVVQSVNLGLTAMENLQRTMNAPVDTVSMEMARNSINQATAAVRELDAAMQTVSSSVISPSIAEVQTVYSQPDRQPSIPKNMELPVTPVFSQDPSINLPKELRVDITPYVTQQPEIDVPKQIDVPVTPFVTQQPEIEVPNDVTIPITPEITQQPEINLPNGIEVPVFPYVTEQPIIEPPENITVPVEAIVTQQPVIDVPKNIEVPVQPYVTQQPVINVPDSIEIPVQVETSGITESEKQIDVLLERLSDISQMQTAINAIGKQVYILPDDVTKNIHAANTEIRRIEAAMDYLKTNPFQLDDSIMNLQIDAITKGLDTIAAKQQQIDTYMGGAATKTVNIDVIPNVATPSIPQPDPVKVGVEWVSDNFDVFTSSGVDRFQQELQSANAMMQQLCYTQEQLSGTVNGMEILSPQAKEDLSMVQDRLLNLQTTIQKIGENPLHIDSGSANADLEQLRGRLSKIIGLQDDLCAAMKSADVSQINAAYLQLSQNIGDGERMVRDAFSDIPPVEIPVAWKTDSLEVFTSTGIDRFQQEVQSANNMLNTLNTTQERIATTAAQTNLFAPGAVADMRHMNDRLQAIQERMQQIENNPMNMGTENANAELEQLRDQLNHAVQEQENLNHAVSNMDVQAANDSYLRLSQTIGHTERYIRDNVDEQGRFNQKIEEGVQRSNDLADKIKRAAGAYLTIQSIGKIVDLSDTMTQTNARLNLMVDDGGSVKDLENKIYLSAQRSRAAYQTTADAVAKLGLNAGNAFASNDELIAFTEQINKQFAIAGTDAQGIDAAMLQLSQAMGSGVLRGEEFNSILEQAPNMIQSIADYMEVPKGELKNLAADGVITADIVKNAMLSAADQTNAKFESMPMTFSQIWTSFQNTALMAFRPVLEQLNEIANSEAFQQFVDHAVEGLSVVSGIALEIFDSLVGVANTVADNWAQLSPIIYGVATALAVYYGWQLISNAILAISTGFHTALAIAQIIHAAATGALTTATAAEIAAQNGLNTALYACPITWIIIAIVALIAIFYAAIAAINKFANKSISATGVICGVFMVGVAHIGNLFVTLVNRAIDYFAVLWNFIASFANFFANVFNDPVGAIARLFFDLVDTILSLLQSLAGAIDAIFGSNLSGSVSGWRDSLEGWVDATYGKGNEVMTRIHAEDYHFEKFDYGKAWDAGYNFGEGIEETISNFDPSSLFNTDVPSPGDYANLGNYAADSGLGGLGGIGDNVGDIAGNTGAIADAMDIAEEDLKYLRDIAEQEAINRYTTAEITIEQTNNNNISSEMDLDGVVTGLTDAVNEAVEIITEGVHA